MNRAYKIKNKIYSIDKNKYRCSSTITDREKEYFAKHLNELYDVNTGFEIINNTSEKKHYKVYAFYNQEELVKMMTISLMDDDVSLHNLFADDKNIITYMIQYAINEYKKDIFTTVIKKHEILLVY